jgi:CRISPR-associated protein Csb2
MLRLTFRFPLGVCHGQSAGSSAQPEWPPHPTRAVGALLAATHGRHGADPQPDRELLQRICAADPPAIHAPESAAIGDMDAGDRVARLRGATRWAPRNYVKGPVSPRNLGRERAEVSKAGVAIGDLPVHMVWHDLTFDAVELDRLAALASDVTFLGTSRSPVLVEVGADPPPLGDGPQLPVWTPASDGQGVLVRVPDERSIAAFDRREAARRSDRAGLRPAGMVPQLAIGQVVQYRIPSAPVLEEHVDPRWWGELLVLAVDRDRSELRPKAPAAYLMARAVRQALLGTFGDKGEPDEAPAILTARGDDPHCAVVPLPNVWGRHADGRLLGVAIFLPHERRVPDLAAQRARVEAGLRSLVENQDRFVQIPGAGRVQLALPDARAAQTRTLGAVSYRRPARSWVTVTPVVHSRWRKGGADGLLRQVTADCAHVGLPAPVCVEVLRTAGRRGGAHRLIPVSQVPERWRGPLQGPADHLRITFEQPVTGPILLGRARHFGVGLCVPDGAEVTSAAAERAA